MANHFISGASPLPPSVKWDTETCLTLMGQQRRVAHSPRPSLASLISDQRVHGGSGHTERCSIPCQSPLVSLSSTSSSEARSQALFAPTFGASRSGEGKQEGRTETTGRGRPVWARPVWPRLGGAVERVWGAAQWWVQAVESSGIVLTPKREPFSFCGLHISSPAHAISLPPLGKEERH